MCLSPFLKTGTIDADRRSLWMVPLSSESWNMHRSIGDSSSAKSWRTLAGISSGPVALCYLMFLSNFLTPSSEMFKSCMS